MESAMIANDDLAAVGEVLGPDETFDFDMGGGAADQLSKRQKAAVIVRLLLAEGAELSLQDLPEALQAEMIRQMSTMRYVDRATLKAVVDEFVNEIEDVGLAFPPGVEGALTVFDGTISPATAARVRKLAGVNLYGDPWATIKNLDFDTLLATLESESIEVAAVLLSKLKVPLAAQLLGELPGPRARQVAYAVSQTENVAPEIVERIGRALADQHGSRPPKAFDDPPVERVGAILNATGSSTREEVLDGLEQDDNEFASAVRRAIFTFADIPTRVEPTDVPKFTKAVDQTTLVSALAAATGDMEPAAEFILGAMSKRMAEQLREEIAACGPVKAKTADKAMAAVIDTIRTLESVGDITLITDEDDED